MVTEKGNRSQKRLVWSWQTHLNNRSFERGADGTTLNRVSNDASRKARRFARNLCSMK